MFSGIVTDMGCVSAIGDRGDRRFLIATAYDPASIDIGASIACSGVCLTVIAVEDGAFAVQASQATLDCTTLGGWVVGAAVNLERALKIGDELGGHLVTGHVDGLARVAGVEPVGESRRIVFETPQALARFVAPKGSVALDGVSLTVNEVEGARFSVNIIPHTLRVTTLGALAAGDAVNLEVDLVARYLDRLMARE